LRSAAFFAALGLAIALAMLALRAPTPRGADIAADEFSAARAMEDIRIVAERPHPIGSADLARVRGYLVSRMTQLGLAPALRAGRGTLALLERGVFVVGNVTNIVGVLPGADPALPAVLLMAHYDTVPNSPGAADDTAGVAAILEIVANLKAGGPRRRDVMVLFTDGEEAGLLGSSAFFSSDPLAKRVALVLNLEARGGGGRAIMFETSDRAGGLVSLYGQGAALPAANSLTAFVYRRMPNGTDLTNALRNGFSGLNFAFVGDELDYHTAHATPESVDPGSVQHMGDSVLALVRSFATATEWPGADRDLVYSDILGLGFVAYPVWAGWLPIALAAASIGFALWRRRERGGVHVGELWRGAVLFPLVALGTGIVLTLLGWLVAGFTDVQMKYVLLTRYELVLGGYLALAVGVALAIVAGFLALPSLGRGATAEGLWYGGLVFLLVLTTALQIAAPATAFILAWPLLLAAAAATFFVADKRSRTWIAATAIGVLGAAQAAEWGGMLFTALGVTIPAVLIGQVLAIAMLLWPTIFALATSARRWVPSLALVGAGLLAIGYARFAPADADHPHLTQAFYAAGPGADDFSRISDLPQLDDWARSALTADGGKVQAADFEPWRRTKVWAAEAKPAAVGRPRMAVERTATAGARRTLSLRLTPARAGRELRLFVKSTVELSDVVLGGALYPGRVAAGEWLALGYAAQPADGVTLAFTAEEKGRIEVKLAEVADGWPAGATVPPKPASLMPWRYSDTTVGLSDFSASW